MVFVAELRNVFFVGGGGGGGAEKCAPVCKSQSVSATLKTGKVLAYRRWLLTLEML